MPTITPRPNQIEELIRGLDLPLSELAVEHLEIISEVIGAAWQDLLQTQIATLISGTEPEVNALLVTRLNALLNENSFWQQLVRSVSRGAEIVSFDGSHLEKKPDLSIHLTGRNPCFPLIAECKIIDSTTQRGVDTYCKDGLRRFLIGEYAWPGREAIMLAYVRDGSSITSTLTPFLAESEAEETHPYAVEQLPNMFAIENLDSAGSKHSRTFKYVVDPPANREPGAISIWHLWMAAA